MSSNDQRSAAPPARRKPCTAGSTTTTSGRPSVTDPSAKLAKTGSILRLREGSSARRHHAHFPASAVVSAAEQMVNGCYDNVLLGVAHRVGRPEPGVRRALAPDARDLDETEPSDMVEYHVVRQGVDEHALVALFENRRTEVQLETYFTTALPLLQKVGARYFPHNTFGILARDRN